jgi:serine/threonine protein kinase
MAEHYRRRGLEADALRHYEIVLAHEVDYPNVRARVSRLRIARGRDAPGDQGATVAGVASGAAQTGSRYHLVRELGRGATGVVYLARDAELERDVAVKLLHPHLAAAHQQDACKRFFAEARIAASLRHPNIVAIFDLNESARRIVMEHAAGGTLRDMLTDGPLPLRRALRHHVELLSALRAAHRRSIVHRDIKPGNIMFRRPRDAPASEIILGDFGIANLPDSAEHTRDETDDETRVRGRAVGTLGYMPPEQRRDDQLDGRADIYAASVVLYEMLVGRHPLSKETVLKGTRSADDFVLPDEFLQSQDPELARALLQHLSRLSHPDSALRTETIAALSEAKELLAAALVASA